MFSFALSGFGIVQIVMSIIVFAFSAIIYLHYSKSIERKIKVPFILAFALTFVSVLGIFVSDDLLSLFACFEVMSCASVVLLLDEHTKEKISAAKMYLATSIITGMVMLMGVFLLHNALGTLNISELKTAAETANKTTLYVAGALTLVGFCTKAAMYPLHFWLAKTYYNATAPITAIFSSVLSKAGVFGIIVVSANIFYADIKWGEVLIIFALITMVWGGFCAVKSSDMKKIIAFSSMSQIGFILFGVAMNSILGSHNAIAASGIVLHMLNHSAFKLVLFTLCTIAFLKVGSTKLEAIRGLARKNKLFAAFFIISAAGLMGLPGLSGYVSKTLLHESAVEYIHLTHSTLFTVYEYIFLFAGGLTICYMLKISAYLFAKPKDGTPFVVPIGASIGMGISSIYAIVGGILPNLVLEWIANFSTGIFNAHHMEPINYFSLINLRGAGISIAIGLTLYVVLTKTFISSLISKVKMPSFMKFENLYKLIFGEVVPKILCAIFKIISALPEQISVAFCNVFFKPAKEKNALGHVLFSYRFGEGIDAVADMFNIKTKNKFADLLSDLEKQSSLRRRMISASLSYGLLFAGIGFIGVLVYMLIIYL